ncbi:uncharacterized protein LOC111026387 [Myzus persicae]|uniref:uncharacterized protein LOC111026387 n=1 Tax=Myzus persicae TaxID=13164 RepID=UPI000B931F55|nr:uncharacterized protein LOC111026387 [Myzus persicae]
MSFLVGGVDDCKKRWKNIKDTYNKKRRGRKLGTGSATKEKPSKWILEDALSFMDTAINERQSVKNVSHEDTIIEEDHISSNDNSVITQMEPEIHNVSSISTLEPIAVAEKSEKQSTSLKR